MAEYNLPIDTSDAGTAVMVEAALDWVDEHTTLDIDRGKELPSNVKLFVVKYCELLSQTAGVTSESLGGMSQSFSTGGIGSALSDLATHLFGSAYKGRNRFVTAAGRWK